MPENKLDPSLLTTIRSTARLGEVGRPIEVPIERIEEDPANPRGIDEVGIPELAETIKVVGILQPVTLIALPGGRWRIKFGHRRLRAAKVAGLSSVPAFVAPADNDPASVLAARLVENQHHLQLTDGELAEAIRRLTEAKFTNARIAAAINVGEQQIKHYRAILRLPADLGAWVDRIDARTLYELSLAWSSMHEQGREHIRGRLQQIEPEGTLSITEARRVIERAVATAGSGDTGQGDVRRAPPRRVRAVHLRGWVRRLVEALNRAADMLEAADRTIAEEFRTTAREAEREVREGEGRASVRDQSPAERSSEGGIRRLGH